MNDRLSVLWASDGSSYCLSTAETLRDLLLPSVRTLGIVSVAPLREKRAALKRLLGMGDEVRREEEAKAQAAVHASAEALGELPTPVQQFVRWGSTVQEVRRVATEIDADILVASARPYNAFRQVIMEDTSLAILKASHRSMLLARPPVAGPRRTVIIHCDSPTWLNNAIDVFLRLALGGDTKVYLASFSEPPALASGLFFSYSEYRQMRADRDSMSDHHLIRPLLQETAESLRGRGYGVEVVIGEGPADKQLATLAADVSAGLVIVGATPYTSGFFSSTAAELDAALPVACSVLVAR